MKKIYTFIASLLISVCVLAQTEFEPNNTILQNTTSNTFTAPDTIGAYITASAHPDSVDFFKIILPYCGSWSFNIINDNGTPCLLRMTLYDAQNISNWIISSTGVDFNFNNGIPNPVVLNCSQVIYVKIDEISGSDIGAYSLSIIENIFNGFVCNSDTASAALVSVDTTFQAKLFGYDCGGNVDVDWYRVAPSSCGVLNINITGVNSLQEIKIECFDSSFTLIGNAPTVAGGANNSVSVLLSGGISYLIKISDRFGFSCGNQCTDPYDLVDDPFTVTLLFDTTDACECNNRIEDACEIPINTTFDSKLWGTNYLISDGSSLINMDLDGDQDWYKVVAPSCGVLNIHITGVNTLQEMKIECFNSNQVSIANAQDVVGGSSDSLSVLLSAGVSYIRISDRFGFNCGNQCSDPYDLVDDPFTVSLSFDTTDACECNNRIEEACEIPINTTFDSKLFGINYLISNGSALANMDLDGDQDWYKVVTPECGVLNINITSVNTLQEIKIECFDSTQTLIGTAPNANGGANVSYSIFIASGTSYIRISDRYGFNCGNQCSDPYDLVDDPFTTVMTFSPLADITSTLDSACLGEGVDFTSSDNILNNWTWNFGAGATPSTDTTQNPSSVIYNSAGQKTVTLSSNGCSVDSILMTIYPVTPTPSITYNGSVLTSSSVSGNQWYLNNNPISNATNSTFTVAQNGTYKVCVIIPSSCGNPCSDTVAVSNVGIEDLDLSENIKMYPNPTNGKFRITFPSITKQIQISNSIGQVLETKLLDRQTSLDFELTVDGIYFVQIQTDKQIITKKLIVYNH